ncbi:Protein vav-1 [Aphelenchoides besseyi]|nr:Protein vav-1 [Aphelenchoides besseyi]
MPMDEPPRRRTTKSRLNRPILGLQQYRSLDVAESEIFAKFTPSRPPIEKVPELTENYYTSRVFGVDESVVNHYTLEPTVLEEKSKKKRIKFGFVAKGANISSDYRSKCGQEHVKLSDMLTVPMQRILKYHLLLNQLLENTPVGDEEVELLDRAYECMKDVSDYVNEGKRDNEIKAIVREIQGKVINSEQDPDCEYYGRLQQDGSCKVMDTTLGNQQKKRYVFLFDKVLMICKSNYGQTGEMKKTYPVSSLQIVETERETQLSRSTSTLTRKLTNSLFDYISLTVRVQDCSGQPQSYIQFVFQRMSQRDMWRKAIEGAIDRCNPVAARRHRHDVVYSSYQIPTHCNVCHKLLLGLFYQVCKKNIHYKCLGLGNTLCPQKAIRFVESKQLERHNTHSVESSSLSVGSPLDVGERVRALQSVSSPDGAVLNFQQGDTIEITRENDDGTLTGRLLGTPSRSGVFSRDIVERVPRSFSSASTSCLTSNGSAADRLSGMTEAAERRPNLVTSARITLFEQRNAPLEDQPWFFGELERQQVKMFLELTEDGTFLVRRSSNLGQYVLSIMYDGNEKHMKIEMDPENRLFYLHAARYFHDIQSLIEHYRRHSLSEGFENLCTTLKGTPLRQKNFRAEYPFVELPNDSSRFLRLEADTQVRVLDTSEEEKGWWMGISRGVTGYFPYAFVEEDNILDIIETVD